MSRFERWGLSTAVALLYFGLLFPLVVVLAVSFNPTSAFAVPTSGISLRWYQAFFSSASFTHSMFAVSLPVASVAAAVATVLGTLAAIAITRLRFRGRNLVETLFLTPLLVPTILLGAALYIFYSRIGIAGTIGALMMAHILIAVPYVIRVVCAGLAGIDPRLEEAAMSLGAGPVTAFVKVVIPLLRSSLVSGAIFAFLISFGDINVALFVSGPQTTTLPLQIFSEIVWEGDPTIAAASAMQIVLVGGLVLLMQRLFRIRMAF